MDNSGWQEGAGPAATDGATLRESAAPDSARPGEQASAPSGPSDGALGASQPDDEAARGTASQAASSDPKSTDPKSSDSKSTDSKTDGAKPAVGPGTKKKRRRSFWRELPVLIVVALVLALVIKTYALQAFFIPSGSMENTLDIGDRVLINKLVYDFRDIHRGDVIVFNGAGSWDTDLSAPSTNPLTRFFTNIGQMIGIVHGEDDYVKRVIGLPGDHVACCDAQGRITVNDVPLNESTYLYPENSPSDQRFSITVPQGRLWVMGDHRAISYDSRGHMGDPGGGTIPENEVLGRVFVRIWPPSRWGFLPIPGTFQQPKLNESLQKAIDSGTVQVQAAAPQLPLVLGFAGAVPLTLLSRPLRRRPLRRRRRRRGRRGRGPGSSES